LTEIHTTLLSLCRFQGTRGAVLHGLEKPRHSQARSFKTEQRCLGSYDQTPPEPGRRDPGFRIHRATDRQVPSGVALNGCGPAVLVTANP